MPIEVDAGQSRERELNGAHERLLCEQPGRLARALGGKQLGDYNLHALFPGFQKQVGGKAAKEMKDVAFLSAIVPSEIFHLYSKLLQPGSGLFDLNLLAAVRQRKRKEVIEKN